MSVVFLFPGQGAQKSGMGLEMAEAFPDIAGNIFRRADEILGIPLSRYCFEGPDEELARTEITQPALFTTCVAILAVLTEKGVRPAATAGHSVGEYAALVSAGAITFEDALPVVRRRAELMRDAVADTPGAMAALIGLSAEQVSRLCQEAGSRGIVEPSNLNAPTQIVVSGEEEAVLAVMEAAKVLGAKAIRLNVSAPFHCSMMRPVLERLRSTIEKMPVSAPTVPVIANVTAQPVSGPDEIRQLLLAQIESPVRWTETMQYLLAGAYGSLFEIGPGKVLAGLFRATDRSVTVTGVSIPSDIEEVVSQQV